MTVTTQIFRNTFLGNGATVTWSFDFDIPESGDELVIYTDPSGNQTTLNNTQYSISGFNNQEGGSITYPLSGSPIPVGSSLTVARNAPFLQLTSFNNQGPLLPSAIEAALDYLMMCLQQLNSPAAIINYLTGGPGIALTGTSDVVISAYEPVNIQTSSTYTVNGTDQAKLIVVNAAAPATIFLNTSAYTQGFFFDIINIGNNPITITPMSGSINGAQSLPLLSQYSGGRIVFDGVNYEAIIAGSSGSSTLGGRTAIADANYSIKTSDRWVSYTALTATRVSTLPLASSVAAGTVIAVGDESGSCSLSQQIQVLTQGTDTFNTSGSVQFSIVAACSYVEFRSNGSNLWIVHQ